MNITLKLVTEIWGKNEKVGAKLSLSQKGD
jgi:hypothetical protein